jgi:hypothetical protein
MNYDEYYSDPIKAFEALITSDGKGKHEKLDALSAIIRKESETGMMPIACMQYQSLLNEGHA